MINLILFFLAVSVLLYVLLAGADFGAGMVEFFSRRELREKQQSVITHAMAPVWETNHIWLILAVVILFNGFPQIFSEFSTYLHIPILIMLVGIVLRGCAFTFRHYDAIKDRSAVYYTAIFHCSSFITPFMQGVIVGALTRGAFEPAARSFWAAYMAPWLNVFSFSVGFFVCALYSFLAAVFLVGETAHAALRTEFVCNSRAALLLVVICGAAVFIAAELDGLDLLGRFMAHPFGLLFMTGAGIMLGAVWKLVRSPAVYPVRIAACGAVSAVTFGWFALQYPNFTGRADGMALSFYELAAPAPALRMLAIALVLGSLAIFPAIYLLMRTFKPGKAPGR